MTSHHHTRTVLALLRSTMTDSVTTGRQRPAGSLARPWKPTPRPRLRSSRSSSSTIPPATWFDETLASLAAQDYPNLNTLFLLTGVRRDADAARGADHVPPAGRVRPRPRRQPRLRRRRPTRCCAWSRATTGSSCSATTTSRSTPTACGCSSRSCTGRTPASSDRSSSSWDDPRRAPARRPRARPLRRGRPDHRARRVRPGAARRGPRRVRAAVGLPARARRPVPRRSAASTRRSPSTATTSTCAGGPT